MKKNKTYKTYKVSFSNDSIKKEREFRLFQKILDKQLRLNNLTFPTWKKDLTTVDWQCAIMVEAGELLESFGYKWWKKTKKDIENVKVELIDILHFVISNLLTFFSKKRQDYLVVKAYIEFIKGFRNEYLDIKTNFHFKKTLLEMIRNNQKEDEVIRQLFYLAKIFKFLDMNFEDVYRA